MPRQRWPLAGGRPVVEIELTLEIGDQAVTRTLLADTGAGSVTSVFELILDEQDCLMCGGSPWRPVSLGGAIAGVYPVYMLRVKIPQLGFDHFVLAVGVPQLPPGMDGIAGFGFLNRFSFGNFGDAGGFALDVL